MTKNLVLLSDGTGQRGGVGYETNVWRLYKILLRNTPNQLICYDDGVGSQKSRWSKITGGMSAIGLDQNVQELYSFLVHHWQPEDRIYLFGFSRGAFTVRILSDIIARCGIIKMNPEVVLSEKRLKKLVKTAYSCCLKSYYHPEYARKFKEQFARPDDVKIHFIGVWDTVGAIGLPFEEARSYMHNVMEYGFRGHSLNANTKMACHAVSIDDNRLTFHPVMWDEGNDPEPERISQVWFSGMHSNVGGGYPKNQLSRVTLEWMIQQVKKADEQNGLLPQEGLQVHSEEVESISREKDYHGFMYNSRSGPASAFRFASRNMEEICSSYTAQKALVHQAVLKRIELNTDGYSPHNLPQNLLVYSGEHQVETTFSEHWCECMKTAKSYNYLQQVIYHVFMLPVIATIVYLFFVLPKKLFWLVKSIPWFSTFPTDWSCFIFWLKGVFAYIFWGALIFTAVLVLSELLQFPLRKKENRIASQGWFSYFNKNRLNDLQILANSRSSLEIRLSNSLRKIGFMKIYNMAAVVILYVCLLTFGQFYRWYNKLCIQWPRLAEIKNPQTAFICPSKQKEVLFFETSMYRMHTGLSLEKGFQYRIMVEKSRGWFDAQYEATPAGLKDPNSLPSFMKWAKRFSRLPEVEIFTLLGEIKGSRPFKIGSGTTFSCEQSGELILYVNDVSLWPARDIFYLNNRGSARITVEKC